MERLGKYFTFTKTEQESFSLDEVVEVENALDTAFTFKGIASGLEMRAENLIGDASKEGQHRRQKLLERANELHVFSQAIQEACAPSEVDQFIKDTLG